MILGEIFGDETEGNNTHNFSVQLKRQPYIRSHLIHYMQPVTQA